MGCLLWRNNNGAMRDATGRVIRFGLGSESAALTRVCTSSDLIGIGPHGRFMAVECKRPGWMWTGTPRERAQLAFIIHVLFRGGIGGFVTSVEEFEALAKGGGGQRFG